MKEEMKTLKTYTVHQRFYLFLKQCYDISMISMLSMLRKKSG